MATSSKAKGKGAKRTPAVPRTRAAPLEELSRDQLSVFLYVALLPEETRAIVKELGLGVPGFRTEALGEVERCDVIADEIRAHPPSAAPILEALARAFVRPPLASLDLGVEGASDLLAVGGGDSALAMSLWRVLSDASADVRARARPLLDELAVHYFGSGAPGKGEAGGEGGGEGAGDDAQARIGKLEAALATAQSRFREAEERAEARAEEARRRGDEQREKLQAALKEARSRESQSVEESARAREEAALARRDLQKVRSELEQLRSADAAQEAQKARAEARELSGKLGALESRVERLRERERELVAEIERLRPGRPASPPAAARPEGEAAGAEEGEAGEAETWLFPVYTREFYDSLDGWDRRVQRAAFKQANLLALDHRHPSLRALPLEGLPGYYRVRVATDVRLIYRRPERQNVVEILSLIDREDLDRYIRQAKTRG